MKTITIEGHLRTGFGKTATRQLRSQGMVPGVIYGGPEEINFYAPALSFRNLVYTSSFQIAEVKIGDKTYRTILKDLQFDKVTDQLIHVDLLELVEDKKVIANIPIKFTGTAPGVKEGGKFVVKMKSLKVKTYPKYLREYIEVSIDNLQLNGNIRVEDVTVENYEILNSPRIPIASVTMTRQLKQGEAAGAEAAAQPSAATQSAAAGADKAKK
ncbi:MAG: 50S ribosomal protein L25 [Chitinophagaceae bacterium]|nr:50S ribosomal protein L25 [Chitinophagaceae bacterium]